MARLTNHPAQSLVAESSEKAPAKGRAFDWGGWARTYLKKAGLIESPKRGVFRMTPRGRQTLATNPIRIDAKFLEQWPEFIEFRDASKTSVDPTPGGEVAPATTTGDSDEAEHDSGGKSNRIPVRSRTAIGAKRRWYFHCGISVRLGQRAVPEFSDVLRG